MVTSLLINILLFGLLVFSIVTCVFILSVIKRDMSIMDIAYGLTFVLASIGSLIISDTTPPLAILIATLITLWGVRLASRIVRKNWGKPEDARYAAWRVAWLAKGGERYFLIRSYLQVNLFQGLIIIGIAMPFIIALSVPKAMGSWYTIAGALLMLGGLCYETIADWQLDRFLARKREGTESATLMTTGLFRYSRRPNYFGESLVWWGLALIAFPLPFGYLALLSPILITYIVTRITGPMLEKIFLEKYPKEYQAYMARTNYFIPGHQNNKAPQ